MSSRHRHTPVRAQGCSRRLSRGTRAGVPGPCTGAAPYSALYSASSRRGTNKQGNNAVQEPRASCGSAGSGLRAPQSRSVLCPRGAARPAILPAVLVKKNNNKNCDLSSIPPKSVWIPGVRAGTHRCFREGSESADGAFGLRDLQSGGNTRGERLVPTAPLKKKSMNFVHLWNGLHTNYP